MGADLATTRCLILDSEALSRLAHGPPGKQRALVAALKSIVRDDVDGELVMSSSVLAEVMDGRRDAGVWSAIRRLRVRTVSVDDPVGVRAGHLLRRARLDSASAVDAFVAATAALRSPAVILTGDADDLQRLTARLDHVEVVPL